MGTYNAWVPIKDQDEEKLKEEIKEHLGTLDGIVTFPDGDKAIGIVGHTGEMRDFPREIWWGFDNQLDFVAEKLGLKDCKLGYHNEMNGTLTTEQWRKNSQIFEDALDKATTQI